MAARTDGANCATLIRLLSLSFEQLLRVVLLDERGRRADIDALATATADALGERHVVRRHDHGVEAAVGLGQAVDALDLGAHPHAAPAQDALVRVADHAGAGEVFLVMLPLAGEVAMTDAHRVDQPLEFAVAVALAGVAVLGMVVHEQLDDVAPGLAEFPGVRVDLHAVGHRIGARGDEVSHPFDLDDADAARALDGELRMVAQARNMVTALVGRLHDRLAGIDLVFPVIDGDRYLFVVIHVTPQSSRQA